MLFAKSNSKPEVTHMWLFRSWLRIRLFTTNFLALNNQTLVWTHLAMLSNSLWLCSTWWPFYGNRPEYNLEFDCPCTQELLLDFCSEIQQFLWNIILWFRLYLECTALVCSKDCTCFWKYPQLFKLWKIICNFQIKAGTWGEAPFLCVEICIFVWNDGY